MATVHDPRLIGVIINGVELVGFADDTMIQIERSTPRWSADVGARGETTPVRSADDTATATITLKHNSASNNFLHRLWREQDTPGFELSLSAFDRNRGAEATAGGSECRITNLPDFERGAGVTSDEWEILIFDYDAAFEGVGE